MQEDKNFNKPTNSIYPDINEERTPSYRREVNFKGSGSDGDSINQTAITTFVIVAFGVAAIFVILKFLV